MPHADELYQQYLQAIKIKQWIWFERVSKRGRTNLKPTTGRPCVPACLVSGTVPAFTCDCLRFVCAFTRRNKVDLCVSASSRTMLCKRSRTYKTKAPEGKTSYRLTKISSCDKIAWRMISSHQDNKYVCS